ncbi:PadR family transcriptional regulator [Anaerobacillus arseniciselenatis]|uniref:PadR family transcriptional regulator n=1 Tax=Anaerobacillus arseniciselenatis TaxID=85682 RepID=A0A1S2LUY7_9BACI|nr:helix-turn-helix transcriptional regulator [Anaerobacillus arseniciselenatis]OIJ15175.1 PadR family transcriptional regulator [Anaerobacillus arseniciselenatis]
MARSDALKSGELTDSAYYILMSLLEARHGYLIMKWIEEITDGQLSVGPASLYTTLKKLLDGEFIEELSGADDGKRKTYVTTEKGLTLLKKEVERRRDMVLHAETVLAELQGGE